MVREHQFCKRKFRFDFSFPDIKLAVECDGGQYVPNGQGKHNSDDDYTKRNHAALHGWKMMAFTANQIDKQPLQSIEFIQEVYDQLWKMKKYTTR